MPLSRYSLWPDRKSRRETTISPVEVSKRCRGAGTGSAEGSAGFAAAVGAATGGLLGGRWSARLRPMAYRALVFAVGAGATVWLFATYY